MPYGACQFPRHWLAAGRLHPESGSGKCGGIEAWPRVPVDDKQVPERLGPGFSGRGTSPRSRACADPPPPTPTPGRAVPGRVLSHPGFYIAAGVPGPPRCERCDWALRIDRFLPGSHSLSPRSQRAPVTDVMLRARLMLCAAALTVLVLVGGPPGARAGASSAGLAVRRACTGPMRASAHRPGCGCCLTCALLQGQSCGVYTERCGSGLRCQPSPDEARPLQALLNVQSAARAPTCCQSRPLQVSRPRQVRCVQHPEH
ncbi:hypothetical protein P7K49_025010 [Saguinus oedipus]|uniref:IGFBP N-terminal domain-containing protein n=1 Tax=Saguinus oedipus TaxID=9490 RepID=A0ABQ9UGF7_SAGOE|nr:hypothetical protein P7K49_025010 [Saguinus oedipus]